MIKNYDVWNWFLSKYDIHFINNDLDEIQNTKEHFFFEISVRVDVDHKYFYEDSSHVHTKIKRLLNLNNMCNNKRIYYLPTKVILEVKLNYDDFLLKFKHICNEKFCDQF